VASALSYPNQNFPGMFSGSFWADYPFMLPAIFYIVISLTGMILVIVFMCPSASKGT